MSAVPTRTAPSDGLSVALDALPITRTHWFVISLICLGHLCVAGLLVMNSVFGTLFTPDVKAGKIAAWELSILLGCTGIGAAIGAPLMGALADRFGRRPVLALGLTILASLSIAGALAKDIEWLIPIRLVSALGIGCFMPVSTTLLAELFPARTRGRAVAANAGMGSVGGVLSGLLTAWLNTLQPFGLSGWQSTMILWALGLIFVVIGLALMPESPRWLRARGRTEESGAAFRKVADMAADAPLPVFDAADAPGEPGQPALGDTRWTPERKRRIGLLALLSFLFPWGGVTFPLLGGAIMALRGYGPEMSLVFQSVIITGAVAGALFNFLVIDRIPRIRLLVSMAILQIVGTATFGLLSSPIVAMVSGAAIVAGIAVYMQVMLLYGAELFPPLLRGKVPAICFGINRFVSIFAPLIMLPLLTKVGEWSVLGIYFVLMIVSLVILLTVPFHKEDSQE